MLMMGKTNLKSISPLKSKCRKYHIKSNTFSSWYDSVKEIVDKRLKFYENKHPQMFVNNANILEKETVKKIVKRLQNKYIKALNM